MFSAAARPCQPAASKAALNGAPHGVWLKLPQAWMRALLSWAARVRVRWACRAGRPAGGGLPENLERELRACARLWSQRAPSVAGTIVRAYARGLRDFRLH